MPIAVPSFGITTAYGDNESELASALGIYLASWFIVTFVSLGLFGSPHQFVDESVWIDLLRRYVESLGCPQRPVLLLGHYFPLAVRSAFLAI